VVTQVCNEWSTKYMREYQLRGTLLAAWDIIGCVGHYWLREDGRMDGWVGERIVG
jgi:hypothetical protein